MRCWAGVDGGGLTTWRTPARRAAWITPAHLPSARIPSTVVGVESCRDPAVVESCRGGDPALPGAGIAWRLPGRGPEPCVADTQRAGQRREAVAEDQPSPAGAAQPHGRTGSAGQRVGVLTLGQRLVIDKIEGPGGGM